MTELEEKFYEVFQIKEIPTYNICDKCFKKKYYGNACVECIDRKINVIHHYPPITDHILLELVCILNQEYHGYELCSDRINDLKNEILQDCIDAEDYIKDKVRKLFEE